MSSNIQLKLPLPL